MIQGRQNRPRLIALRNFGRRARSSNFGDRLRQRQRRTKRLGDRPFRDGRRRRLDGSFRDSFRQSNRNRLGHTHGR
jgi:hypothetical protein